MLDLILTNRLWLVRSVKVQFRILRAVRKGAQEALYAGLQENQL